MFTKGNGCIQSSDDVSVQREREGEFLRTPEFAQSQSHIPETLLMISCAFFGNLERLSGPWALFPKTSVAPAPLNITPQTRAVTAGRWLISPAGRMSPKTDLRTDEQSDDKHRTSMQRPGDKRAAVLVSSTQQTDKSRTADRLSLTEAATKTTQVQPDKTRKPSWTLSGKKPPHLAQVGRTAGLNTPGDSEPQVGQMRLITGAERTGHKRTKVILTRKNSCKCGDSWREKTAESITKNWLIQI